VLSATIATMCPGNPLSGRSVKSMPTEWPPRLAHSSICAFVGCQRVACIRRPHVRFISIVFTESARAST
jgi:hypothetical protein